MEENKTLRYGAECGTYFLLILRILEHEFKLCVTMVINASWLTWLLGLLRLSWLFWLSRL